MDAGKIVKAKGDPAHKITDVQAVRIALATALRDLADEIEQGKRAINEIQTFEGVQGTLSTSVMHLITSQQAVIK